MDQTLCICHLCWMQQCISLNSLSFYIFPSWLQFPSTTIWDMPYCISPRAAFLHAEWLISSTWNSSWGLGRNDTGGCPASPSASDLSFGTRGVVCASSGGWIQDRINTIKGNYEKADQFLKEHRLSITDGAGSHARKSSTYMACNLLTFCVVWQPNKALLPYLITVGLSFIVVLLWEMHTIWQKLHTKYLYSSNWIAKRCACLTVNFDKAWLIMVWAVFLRYGNPGPHGHEQMKNGYRGWKPGVISSTSNYWTHLVFKQNIIHWIYISVCKQHRRVDNS